MFLLYFSSTYALRRSLAQWKKLQEDGIITQPQFTALRRAALEWYTQRWFGTSSLIEREEDNQRRQNATGEEE